MFVIDSKKGTTLFEIDTQWNFLKDLDGIRRAGF